MKALKEIGRGLSYQVMRSKNEEEKYSETYARKRGELINIVNIEEDREKKLRYLSETGDYVSKYYLGKIYEERGDIEGAMKQYISSLKANGIAAKALGNLIRKYPKTYKKVNR